MCENLELRLVNIRWHSQDKFAYINEKSQNPIRIVEQKNKHFTAEIPSYPRLENKLACQFAVQLKSVLAQEIPKVKREDDAIDLFPILDSKHGKWWIEKGEWEKQYKYHDAPSCRHAGDYTINIGDIIIHLNITPSGFSFIEYQNLLNSFKGELWQLILDKNSTSTISKEGKIKFHRDEFNKKVSKFIMFANEIIDKPNEELIEKQEIQRIEKVRPTSKTFMELAAKGNSVKFLTGRGYEPSYNTQENRYIADIIKRLTLIVKNLTNGLRYIKNSVDNDIQYISNQLFQSCDDFVAVDSNKLDAEIQQEKIKKKRWEQKKIKFEEYFTEINVICNEYSFKKEILFTVNNVDFKNEYPDYIDIWIQFNGKKKALIKIPSESCDVNFLTKKATYKFLDVYYVKTENDYFHIATIRKISKIEVILDPYDYRVMLFENEKKHYVQNGWKKKLTVKEMKEKEVELLGIKSRKDILSNIANKYKVRLDNLESIYQELFTLSNRCKFLKITVDNRLDYPGTMTFIQNPSYRGAYSSYKEIQNEGNLEDLFEDLLAIQKFGITDQPNIYEKWCLLKIINILEDYGFAQDENWKKKLVSLVGEKKNLTCSFIFKHPSFSHEIELIYQPELENRKRPDFLLSIKSNTGKTVLVLDAKNKDYNQASSHYNTFSDDLNELVNLKDYAEFGNNAVFILHPMQKEGFLPVVPTSQKWSNHTAFGGSRIFDWEKNDFGPEHMYGGAKVTPGNLDNLKMVIALSLQYLTEDNHKAYNKKFPINTRFCIICGCIEFDTNKKCESNGIHYTCTKCQHFFVEHYCGCGNRLWKHGVYWTYHDTRSTEPYNIKCPQCNDFFIDKDESTP